MNSQANTRSRDLPLPRPPLSEASLGRALQRALTYGWEDFMKSEKLRALRAFAALLDGAGYVEAEGRMRLPHPAYDVAALYIGIPFMEELRARKLSLDSWFPGDVDRSEEVPVPDADINEASGGAKMGARAFHSLILREDGSALCRVAITFPYLKDGFGFPRAPSLSIMFDA